MTINGRCVVYYQLWWEKMSILPPIIHISRERKRWKSAASKLAQCVTIYKTSSIFAPNFLSQRIYTNTWTTSSTAQPSPLSKVNALSRMCAYIDQQVHCVGFSRRGCLRCTDSSQQTAIIRRPICRQTWSWRMCRCAWLSTWRDNDALISQSSNMAAVAAAAAISLIQS